MRETAKKGVGFFFSWRVFNVTTYQKMSLLTSTILFLPIPPQLPLHLLQASNQLIQFADQPFPVFWR
jgi:hypothetical protein